MKKSTNKKREALGMNIAVANRRLQKDLLFKFVCLAGKNECFRCGRPMTREDFTMDHKDSWIKNENPVEAYFDVDNVAFSHHTCNSKGRLYGKETTIRTVLLR